MILYDMGDQRKGASILYSNVDIMQEWLQQYKQEREVESTLPILPSQEWVYKFVMEAKENGEVISIEVMDYAYGCEYIVTFF